MNSMSFMDQPLQSYKRQSKPLHMFNFMDRNFNSQNITL